MADATGSPSVNSDELDENIIEIDARDGGALQDILSSE